MEIFPQVTKVFFRPPNELILGFMQKKKSGDTHSSPKTVRLCPLQK